MGVMTDPSPSAECGILAFRAGTTRMNSGPASSPNQGKQMDRSYPPAARPRETQSTREAATHCVAPEVPSLQNKLVAFAQTDSSA
jgi:hypothetical protein